MIRNFWFLLPLLAAVVITSCKDDDVPLVFSISPQDITFKSDGDTTLVSVYGDKENWKMWIGKQDKETWCSFNPEFTQFTMEGKGRTESIKVYSKANPNRFKLKDTLYLEDLSGRYGIIKVKLTLSAVDITFNVVNNDTLRYIPQMGGDIKVKLNTNVEKRAFEKLPSNVTESYNSVDSTYTFNFAENAGTNPLVTDIAIVGSWEEPAKTKTINLRFIQDGVTSRKTDSLALVKLNSTYSLGWNTASSMETWKGVDLGPIENSEGIVHRVLGLDLSNKALSGALPVDATAIPYLNALRLNNNQFTGMITDGYYELIHLETLWLGNNQLTGTLNNDKILNWPLLLNLSIVNTSMTGEIPTNLSKLEKLRSLQLSGNLFTGNLPEELGNSKILKVLTVNGNDLSGTIPQSYRKNINWYDWNPEVTILPQRNGNLN